MEGTVAGSTEFKGLQVEGVESGESRGQSSRISASPGRWQGPLGVRGVRGVRGVGAEIRGGGREGRMPAPLLLGGALLDIKVLCVWGVQLWSCSTALPTLGMLLLKEKEKVLQIVAKYQTKLAFILR